MVNKYLYGSKVSSRKFRSILRYFCLEVDAKKTAILVNLNRNQFTEYLEKYDYGFVKYVKLRVHLKSEKSNLMRVILEQGE